MKITHIIPALTKGGAERVLIDLANEAAARGHEVTVVAACPVDPTEGQAMLHKDVRLEFIATRRSRFRRYALLPGWVARHSHFLRGQDVVHCHLTLGALVGTAIRVLRRLHGGTKPRVVETFHGVGMPIKPWQLRLATALASQRDGFALMAEDAHWTRFAARHPALPLAIIPNGIAIDAAMPSDEDVATYRKEVGIPRDARAVVGTVGRMLAERKPLAIIEAFAEIARRCGDGVHFLMGGNGPMLAEVRAAGDEAGLGDRLHLPGLVIEPRIAMRLMDLYVSINVGPITGIAGLEAAATHVPLIALQTLPHHRLSDRDWIWSDARPKRVGEEAAQLLADPAARAAMAERQHAYVLSNHSAASMASAYEALYVRAGAQAG